MAMCQYFDLVYMEGKSGFDIWQNTICETPTMSPYALTWCTQYQYYVCAFGLNQGSCIVEFQSLTMVFYDYLYFWQILKTANVIVVLSYCIPV